MIVYCPRCRLPLEVDPPTDAEPARRYTCPGCLETVTVTGRPPALPPLPVVPLAYQSSGDVEAEVQRDLKFVVWGIAVFGVTALIGFLAARSAMGELGPVKMWLGWIAVLTAIVAAVSFGLHMRRSKRLRTGDPRFRPRGTGAQVARVVVLGVSGLMVVVITGIAALVLLFAACIVMATGAGKF